MWFCWTKNLKHPIKRWFAGSYCCIQGTQYKLGISATHWEEFATSFRSNSLLTSQAISSSYIWLGRWDWCCWVWCSSCWCWTSQWRVPTALTISKGRGLGGVWMNLGLVTELDQGWARDKRLKVWKKLDNITSMFKSFSKTESTFQTKCISLNFYQTLPEVK